MMIRRKLLPIVASLLGLGLVGLAAPEAHAGFVATLDGVSPAGGGKYLWKYNIDVDVNTTIQKGDYFTIYDVGSYIPNSATSPNGWVFSTTNVGVTPPKTTPIDNPALPNLTWTYTGDNSIVGPQLNLPDFTFLSMDSGKTLEDFGSKTHVTNTGRVVVNVTSIDVPVPSGGGTPQAPEPATLVMLGMGLPMLGAYRMMRRRKAAAC